MKPSSALACLALLFALSKSTPPKKKKQKAKPGFVPFLWEVESEHSFHKAEREYTDYITGKLSRETYPLLWETNEDAQIVKLNPGAWVEINKTPRPASDVVKGSPDWLKIAHIGAGLALLVAPEVLAYYGVTGGLTVLAAADLAHRAAAVILEARKGLSSAVAEVGVQLFSLSSPAAETFKDALAQKLKEEGLRVLLKQTGE